MPFPTSTSAIAASIAIEGMALQIATSSSPPVFNSVANVQDWNEPNKSETVDVTNVGDKYRRRIATLLDLGICKAKIFWVMTEPTHENAIAAAIHGLRYIWQQQELTLFQVVYPMTAQPVDRFYAYVTGFQITGKVGNVFEAEIEFSPNDGAPLLV